MSPTEQCDILSYARDHKLGLSTLHALIYLHEKGETTLSGLAGVIGVSSASVTGTADKLIQLGYATRRHSAADRRAIFLTLTPKGTAIAASALAGPAL